MGKTKKKEPETDFSLTPYYHPFLAYLLLFLMTTLISDQSEPTQLLVEFTLLGQKHVLIFTSTKALTKFFDKNFNAPIVGQKRVPVSEIEQLKKEWEGKK